MSTAPGGLHEHRAGDDWVALGSAAMAEAISTALAERGRAVIGVSGGSTPRPVFDRLTEVDLDWSRVVITQVDERIAPDGDADRNAGDLQAAFGATPAVVMPLPVTWPDLGAAAAWWSSALDHHGVARDGDGWPRFDLLHLGLGGDGHTASLVPDDEVLDVADRSLAVTDEYQGRRRLTMTYPVLDRARALVWLAPGEGKRTMVERLLTGDRSIPGGRVRPSGPSIVVTDAPSD